MKHYTADVSPVEKQVEEDVRKDIERIFGEKKKKLGVEATLELTFLSDFPVVGEYVYGEAFPTERRMVLDVYAPMATTKAITRTICEELMHIKRPELKHGTKFWKLVRDAMATQQRTYMKPTKLSSRHRGTSNKQG